MEEVTSFARAGDDRADSRCGLEFDQLGRITTVRKKALAPTPRDEEDLRASFRIMHLQWETVKLKYGDREVFQEYRAEVWDAHLNWLLGPKVWRYVSTSGMSLAWPDFLEYEWRLRKEALRTVNRQKVSLGEGLRLARDNSRLFQEFFTQPICTSGKKAAGIGERQDAE